MYVDVMKEGADQLQLKLQTFDARALNEMEPAFDAMVKAGMQAATIAQGGTAFQARQTNPKLALDRRLPLCAYSRETFEHGALVSYGPSNLEAIYRSAVYADKILKGAKPSEIPVEQPTRLASSVRSTCSPKRSRKASQSMSRSSRPLPWRPS